ncbi:MaoC family dehydratase [Amaricoccus sp.]|uniref:MaoC family dehydratase n=1 Tax=Amaricoccus sp. TaxID=1872485 RepID=UPI001B5FB144|nr:MaoC family dehydratase [Amaricoccus sp.]MBP7002449.1 MaoC family dehydratase [Amaricoccus sp.]
MTGRLHLEDLREGQRFVSAARTIDAGEIKAFARDFDPQPFHLDEAAAAGSFFGGLAASGWHTAALTMRLLVDSLPFAGGIIGAGGELSWPRPTRPGDTLHVEAVVEKVTPSRSRPDRGMVAMRIETRNQDGETAQLFRVNVMAFRRPATAPSS